VTGLISKFCDIWTKQELTLPNLTHYFKILKSSSYVQTFCAIPIYTGDGNGAFTPDQWIKKYERPKTPLVGVMTTPCPLCALLLEARHSNGTNV
jgi:hypothetical protein